MGRKLGKALFIIGLCGVLGSISYGVRNIYRLAEINRNPSYTRVAEIDYRLFYTSNTPIGSLLASDSNDPNAYEPLAKEHSSLLTERVELLKDPNVADLEAERNKINTRGFRYEMTGGITSLLLTCSGIIIERKKK